MTNLQSSTEKLTVTTTLTTIFTIAWGNYRLSAKLHAMLQPLKQAGSHMIQLDKKHTIHYVDRGPRDQRQAFVLIHGWACDHSMLAAQVRGLSEHYRVLALDLIGHGRERLRC